MTSKKKRQQSQSETRKDEHLKLLAQLEQLDLSESCCDICHCDCFSTHGSSDATIRSGIDDSGICTLRELDEELAVLEELARIENAGERKQQSKSKRQKEKPKETKDKDKEKRQKQKSTEFSSEKEKTRTYRTTASSLHNLECSTTLQLPTKKTQVASTNDISTRHVPHRRSSIVNSEAPRATPPADRRRRAKSACSLRSRSQEIQAHDNRQRRQQQARQHKGTRDCEILQDLLTTLDDSTLSAPALSQLCVRGKGKSKSQQMLNSSKYQQDTSTTFGSNMLAPLQLCASMANLCIAPSIREAYQRVPIHDKKILNRMAVKRSQQAVAKEHAWLARKFWENERLERELLKVEQVEEYKRAVHDKQFQDYLVTKARLNALAQRDLDELQRLRATLQDKDERAKQRIASLRMERDMQLCQRRCDELRRSEAVTVQQEEQHLDDTIRKRDICLRLTQRLRRADELRTQMLDGYLKRLQYDNQMEQLHHETQWHERQQVEQLKRAELKEQIQRKRYQTQRFVDSRQRRHEAITRTAKISASLRELVRQSVTPEGASGVTAGVNAAAAFYVQNHATLSRLLLDRPPSKLAVCEKY